MPRRQPPLPTHGRIRRLPRLWMMTDERQGDRLPDAVRGLPRGSGIVFRHRGLPAADRRRLFEAVRRIARRRGLVLMLAGDPAQAAAWRADGVHGPLPGRPARPLLRSVAAHGPRDLERARRGGADLVFLSPVAATRSHPGARVLGRVRFGLIARRARLPVIALGGLDGPLAMRGVHGWAAIDALTPAPGISRKIRRNGRRGHGGRR